MNLEYRLKYMECKEVGHEGEKINLVCLNADCRQGCLICGLCCEEIHRGHPIKPLKYYLDELSRQYDASKGVQIDIQELNRRRDILLARLSRVVQEIAQQIQGLEEQIMKKYDQLRDKILREDQKKKRFSELYNSLVKEHYGDAQWQIMEYLAKQPVLLLTDNDIFQQLKAKCVQELNRLSLLLAEGKEKNIMIQSKINQKDNSFIGGVELFDFGDHFQAINNSVVRKNAFGMDLNFFTSKQIFNDSIGKISIHLQKFPVNCQFYIGVIEVGSLINMNGKFSEQLFDIYLTGSGNVKNGYNLIGSLVEGDTITLAVKKNQIRIKKGQLKGHLNYHSKNRLLFIGFTGLTKILIGNKYKK